MYSYTTCITNTKYDYYSLQLQKAISRRFRKLPSIPDTSIVSRYGNHLEYDDDTNHDHDERIVAPKP